MTAGRAARTGPARAVVAGAAVAGALGATAGCAPPGDAGPELPNAPAVEVGPCALFALGAGRLVERARCGTVRVPENRAAQGGRRIALRVVVLPAHRQPAAGALVWLDGGPGRGAATDAGYPAAEFAALRDGPDGRDLVLVDQRGTGRSAPLDCAGAEGRLAPLLAPSFPSAAVRACAAWLARRADLTRYTTADAADDLADVLDALGYRGPRARADVAGASYGTRLALAFLRRHPARVRTLVLHGVVGPAEPIPLASALGGGRALAAALAACAADPACRRAAPNATGDLRAALARLDRGPVTVRVWNARRFEREAVTVTRRGFVERLHGTLYHPNDVRRWAPLVRQAAAGDWAPFVRAAAAQQRRRRLGRSDGLMLSVLCAEDAPRLARADTARLAAASPLGLPMAQELVAACATWPRRALEPADTLPVASPAPVLLLSGGLDPVTPPEWADAVARTLPNAVHVVAPGAGHAEGSDCTRALSAAVVRTGDARAVFGAAPRLLTACRGAVVRAGWGGGNHPGGGRGGADVVGRERDGRT